MKSAQKAYKKCQNLLHFLCTQRSRSSPVYRSGKTISHGSIVIRMISIIYMSY